MTDTKGQYGMQPGPRIDFAELRTGNDAQQNGGLISARLAFNKQPVFLAYGWQLDHAFGDVVIDGQCAVFRVTTQNLPLISCVCDLLISAYVVLAGNEDSAMFLQTLGTAWFGPDAFSTRQTALSSVLVPASSVIDDGNVDTITSSLDSSLDWLFASLADGVIKDVGDLLSIL